MTLPCRAQHVAGGAPFGRIDSTECTRDAGHPGRHSWEAPKRERWCERCEMWSTPDAATCPVHLTPTETAEQIRRDRDEYRVTAAEIGAMGAAYRAATGDDFYTVARLRADLAEARARLDAVGEVLSANGCDCPCECSASEHDDDCSRCLACRIDRAAFGGPQ